MKDGYIARIENFHHYLQNDARCSRWTEEQSRRATAEESRFIDIINPGDGKKYCVHGIFVSDSMPVSGTAAHERHYVGSRSKHNCALHKRRSCGRRNMLFRFLATCHVSPRSSLSVEQLSAAERSAVQERPCIGRRTCTAGDRRAVPMTFPTSTSALMREVSVDGSSVSQEAALLWGAGSSLSLADRLCLALANRLTAIVLTADAAWRDLPTCGLSADQATASRVARSATESRPPLRNTRAEFPGLNRSPERAKAIGEPALPSPTCRLDN